MPRCVNCNRLVSPKHFQKYPDHEAVIGDVPPEFRKTLLDQIDNQRVYSQLRSNSEVAKSKARRQAHSLRNMGIDVRKYVARHDDYAEELEGDDIEELPDSDSGDNSGALLWIIGIAGAAIVAIVAIVRSKSNGDSTDSTNYDDPHNLPFYPVDILEAELDSIGFSNFDWS